MHWRCYATPTRLVAASPFRAPREARLAQPRLHLGAVLSIRWRSRWAAQPTAIVGQAVPSFAAVECVTASTFAREKTARDLSSRRRIERCAPAQLSTGTELVDHRTTVIGSVSVHLDTRSILTRESRGRCPSNTWRTPSRGIATGTAERRRLRWCCSS